MISPDVTGIILAGGRSSRMGRDKALLPPPGAPSSTFLGQLVNLLATYCTAVLLVVRDEAQAALYATHLAPSVHVVLDDVPDYGPLMGLRSGLRAISTTHALVTAVDTPLLQPALLAFLLAQPLDESLLVPVVADLPQVLLAIYPRTLLTLIEERLQAGRRDPRSLLQLASVRYLPEEQLRQNDPQLHSFVNINTPEDLAALE